jgi:hypothetical protein
MNSLPPEKCSWHGCQFNGDHIAVADRVEGTYHLCEDHWNRVCKLEKKKSIQEQLALLAKPVTYPQEDE